MLFFTKEDGYKGGGGEQRVVAKEGVEEERGGRGTLREEFEGQEGGVVFVDFEREGEGDGVDGGDDREGGFGVEGEDVLGLVGGGIECTGEFV